MTIDGVNLFFPDGETRIFTKGIEPKYSVLGIEISGIKVKNISLLNHNIVSILFVDESETIYSGVPFALYKKGKPLDYNTATPDD